MVSKPNNSIPVGDADALQIGVEVGEEISSLLDEIVDADTEIKSLKADVKFLLGINQLIVDQWIKDGFGKLDSNSYLG